MGTIRFELRKEKKLKDGQAPIRIIYQIQGQRKYYNTGFKTFPENWDDVSQQAVYFKLNNKGEKIKGKLLELDVKKLNGSLSDLKRDIEKIETKFEANAIIYTLEMVLDELKNKDVPVTKKDSSSKELFAFIDQYITDHELLVVPGSLSVYRSLKSHLQGYEKKAGKKVTFDKINKAFFQGFQNYLVGLTKVVIDKETKEEKKVPLLNDITIAKLLSTLKTFLGYAREHEIHVPQVKFTIERNTELEVIALTQSEFDTLYNMDLSKRPAWAQVRDVFCFSCATSYRYSDLKQLKWHHINFEKGELQLTAVKTGHRNKVPLNPYSIAILKKYKGKPTPLPVISNQRSNEHLATICEWAGFTNDEPITRKFGNKKVETVYKRFELIRMHCGRKTFATLSLERGMPAELVMNIGGWKDYKSFKRYMNITDTRAKAAMHNAWGAKIIKPKLKAV